MSSPRYNFRQRTSGGSAGPSGAGGSSRPSTSASSSRSANQGVKKPRRTGPKMEIRYVYQQERLLDRRTEPDGVYYLAKYVERSDKHNGWEHEDNVDRDLIELYERDLEMRHNAVEKSLKNRGQRLRNGFERGLQLERIMGSTNVGGQLQFVVKFKGCEDLEVLPSSVVNAKCPQEVITFYENRIATPKLVV